MMIIGITKKQVADEVHWRFISALIVTEIEFAGSVSLYHKSGEFGFCAKMLSEAIRILGQHGIEPNEIETEIDKDSKLLILSRNLKPSVSIDLTKPKEASYSQT